MANEFGSQKNTQNTPTLQYQGTGTISGASKHHTSHMLILTAIIIGVGIIVVFMLQSFNLVAPTHYDEQWCKSLLSRHDSSILGMNFGTIDQGGGITRKVNYTLRLENDYFSAEAVSIVLNNGTVDECNLEALSSKGIDLISPQTYSCVNDTAYRLSYKETPDYLYVGHGVTYSLSSKMMKEGFASLNLTRNLTGFAYIDYVSYRTPNNYNNYNYDIYQSNTFTNSYCTRNEVAR
jgi:hypothetical protein